MKLGSKGDISPYVYVVAAIIGVAILLYILWSSGVLPFGAASNEAVCTAYFIRSCQQGVNFNDGIKNVICKSFGTKSPIYGKAFEDCANVKYSGTECETLCNAVLSTEPVR